MDCSLYWSKSHAMSAVEPFKSVNQAEETLSHIEDAVRRTNDIVRHAYQLLDLGAVPHPQSDASSRRQISQVLPSELLFGKEGQSQRQS